MASLTFSNNCLSSFTRQRNVIIIYALFATKAEHFLHAGVGDGHSSRVNLHYFVTHSYRIVSYVAVREQSPIDSQAEELDGFGWTTFDVLEGKTRSRTVGTASGATLGLTAIIPATSGCRAIISSNTNHMVSISAQATTHRLS